MELTPMKCPACGAEILSEHVDVRLGIARCGDCTRVMRLSGSAPVPRVEPSIPSRFKVDDSGERLEIGWRWFKSTHVFMLFFCVAWDSFLFFWYSTALTQNGPWLMIVFPIAHVAVGIGITYSTLSGFLNSTRIAVEQRVLSIRHGPLPWRGNRRLEASTIDQLYCVSKESSNEDSVSYTYEVRARLKDGTEVELLRGLDEPGQALFIEHRLERHLDIPDRLVPGELRRQLET